MSEDSSNNFERILINEDKIEQMETDEKEPSFGTKEKFIYYLKGISSILSSIIHTFVYFSIWILGYTTIYLISFRRHYDKNVDFSYSYCFIPLMHLSFSLSSPIWGVFENKFKFGGKTTIFFSSSVICTAFSIMLYSRNIYIDYILMLIIGFGIAMGYNITKKNACSYFMNRKALICGIIHLIPNIMCFALIFYNEIDILNYVNAPASIEDIYYKKKIFMNYQELIIFELKVIIMASLGAIVLYFQNDPKETLRLGFNEKIENEKNDNDDNYNQIEAITKKKKKNSKKLTIKKVLKSKRTIKLMLMIFLFFPTINLVRNTMRMQPTLYFIYAVIYNVVENISYLIFTIIGCIQFRILFVFLSALTSATSFILIQYYDNEEFFLFLGLILVAFIISGFNIIFDKHILQVYGKENFIEIWGIIRASGGISEIFGIIFNFSLEEFSYAYKIIYFINGCLSLISLIFGITETEEKFSCDE